MAHKTRKTKRITWRWQLDVLLILLVVSIFLWIMTKIDVLDMDRVMQAYLPPIAEPQGVLMPTSTTKRNWLETEILPPEIIIVGNENNENTDEPETTETIAEPETAPETSPVAPPRPVVPPRPPRPPAQAEKTEPPAKNDKVSLTPKDELF